MPIGHHSGVRQKTIFKLQETFETANDLVVVEEPLEIVLQFQRHGKGQHKTLSITMRTPGDDEHLVRGFLFTEGILKHPTEEIERFEFRFRCTDDSVEHQTLVVHLRPDILPEIENLDRHFYTSSSCGVCGKTAIDLALDNCSFLLRKGHPVMPKAVLFGLPKLLNEHQELFQKTGGIHACAIFNKKGELLLFAEDVGRHNALDKLVGKALEAGMVPLQDHVVLLSGRASFELVQKAFMMGTPILAAVGAPSSLAVETAELSGMTLAGFLKNDKCNIYSAPERIQA